MSEVGFSTTGPGLEPVTPVRATATWEKFTRFGWRSFKDGEEKITLARLPEPEAKIFLVADERQRLPHVEGVVTCPILYKDVLGTLRIRTPRCQCPRCRSRKRSRPSGIWSGTSSLKAPPTARGQL